MSCPLSMNAKIYYKIGGVAAGGSWVELDKVRNVTVNMERTEADATDRSSGGWTQSVGTLNSLTIEMEMIWKPDDTGFDVIKNAYLDNVTIGIRALDQVNGEGPEADMIVLTFPRAEEIEDKMVVNATLKPTCSDTPPQWLQGGTASA